MSIDDDVNAQYNLQHVNDPFSLWVTPAIGLTGRTTNNGFGIFSNLEFGLAAEWKLQPNNVAKTNITPTGGPSSDFDIAFAAFLNSSTFKSAAVKDWATFVQAWRNSSQAGYTTVPTDPFGDPTGLTSSTGYSGAWTDFTQLLGIPFTLTSTTNLGDWTSLVANADPSLRTANIDTTSVATVQASLNTMYNKLFEKFLAVSKDADFTQGPGINATQNFFNLFYNFQAGSSVANNGDYFGFATTTLLGTQEALSSYSSGFITGASYANLMSYYDIFKTFFPAATNSQFQQTLVTFVDRQIDETGYFIPSHFTDKWFQALEGAGAQLAANPTLLQARSDQSKILSQAFALLTSMISTIQKVAIAQTGRLDFLTKMQKAYSDLMLQIPALTSANTAGDLADASTRSESNTVLQQDLEQLRTLRQLWTDESSQFQSNISQSQDAAGQQANIASSILQELSGIVATIFQ